MRLAPRRYGLTLVELLVVLTILIILTTIAITSSDQILDQGRYDASQRTLQNIQDAIMGPANQRAPDGTQLISGFVADMGRLPQPVFSGTTIVGDPLRELWDANAVAANLGPAYALTTINIPNGASPTGTTYLSYPVRSVYNPGMAPVTATATMASGWRGPYLQLPAGNNSTATGGARLLDGWGNPFQSLYQPPGSTTFPSAPQVVSGTPQPVNVVCSLGADRAFDTSLPSNSYNLDQYVPVQLAAPPAAPLASFSDRLTGTVSVQVMVYNTASPPTLGYPVTVGTSTDAVEIIVYSPVNGALTATLLPNTTTTPTTKYWSLGATPTPVIPGPVTLTVGPRAVQAFHFDKSTGNVIHRSPVMSLMVPAGGVPTTLTLILQ